MSPLERELRAAIAESGPITVERYMALALGHPLHGYYQTRDPFGPAGDFTTAPEISQMFGELLGLWVASVWSAAGRPSPIRLVELGPGRGTLMADALRALRAVPAMREAVSVHLVETSPVLAEAQRRTLAGAGLPVAHHRDWGDVPGGVAIVLGNEFLDALPIRQFVHDGTAWRERLVGLGPGGDLAFGLAPEPDPGLRVPGRPGDVLEVAEQGAALVRALAERLAREGGAALFVDYGHERTGFGDTLQAVRRHAYVDALAEPGEVDLTAHIDFAALARAAAPAGVAIQGPVGQGEFLRALGVRERAAVLAQANPASAGTVEAALERLTGDGSGQMGRLFKAFALSHPSIGALPGFPAAPENRIAC